jgi:hypothetical protein
MLTRSHSALLCVPLIAFSMIGCDGTPAPVTLPESASAAPAAPPEKGKVVDSKQGKKVLSKMSGPTKLID